MKHNLSWVDMIGRALSVQLSVLLLLYYIKGFKNCISIVPRALKKIVKIAFT